MEFTKKRIRSFNDGIKVDDVLRLFQEQYKKEHGVNFSEDFVKKMKKSIRFFLRREKTLFIGELFLTCKTSTDDMMTMINAATILLKHDNDSEKNLFVYGFDKYVKCAEQALSFSRVIIEFDRLSEAEKKQNCSLNDYDLLCRAACGFFVNTTTNKKNFSFSDLMFNGKIVKTTEQAIEDAKYYIDVYEGNIEGRLAHEYGEYSKQHPKADLSQLPVEPEVKKDISTTENKLSERTPLISEILSKNNTSNSSKPSQTSEGR